MNNEILLKALELKMQLSKRAPKKFEGIHRRTSADQRIYNSFMFSRATTGRWASTGVNFQNIARPAFDDVNLIIDSLKYRKPEYLEMMWGDSIKALSAAVRGMITAKPGHRLLVSDFEQIEARVIAWLAGQLEALDIFRRGEDIYIHAASQIFQVAVADVTKDQRFAGKTAILACGYQGGFRALQKMAGNYGVELEDAFCQEIVTKWRKQNPRIVKYWAALQDAAVKAIQNPGQQFLASDQLDGERIIPPVKYVKWKNYLCCQLPSGRVLYYNKPSIKTKTITMYKIKGEYPRSILYNKNDMTVSQFYAEAKKYKAEVTSFEAPSIRFWGLDSETRQWRQQHTYGGSLAENVTQAVARDLLAEAMIRITKAGYPIVLHVHDEICSELPYGEGSIKEFDKLMEESPHWASGLPVGAAGYESERYRK